MRTRDWATVDFYAVLGVAPTANAEEISVAFRALAKQLHPDRVGASPSDSERFKSVTAAYDVVGDDRLRRSYDQVHHAVTSLPRAATVTRAGGVPPAATTGPTAEPAAVHRSGWRWVAAGVGVTIVGIFATVLIVHLQIDERARRAGRVKTEAVLVVSAARSDVRFTTPAGTVVQVPEPNRVNPGADRNGQPITVLYRPDRPSDVIIDESTAARDITLWIVAVKLLVGGATFLVVGIRRLRRANVTTLAV